MEPNVELQRELTEATRDILARYDIHLRADLARALTVLEVPEGVSAGMALLVGGPDGADVEVVVPKGVAAGDTFEVNLGPMHEPAPAPASPAAGSDQDWVTAPPWVDVKEDTGGSSAPKNPRSSTKPGASVKRRSMRALTGEIRTVNRGDGVDTTLLRKEPNGRSDDDAWLENEAEVENGQTVELLKIENDFAFVRTSDGDEGYVLAKYLGPHLGLASRRGLLHMRATGRRARDYVAGGKYKRKSKRKSKRRKSKKRKSKRKTKKR